MKNKIIIAVILLSSTLYGQKRCLDNGGGDWKKLALAVTTLDWVEQNKPEKIVSNLLDNNNVDLTHLKSMCEEISKEFPYDDGQPGSYLKNDDTTLWYERTYYNEKGKQIKYLFQVYIELEIKNNKPKISKIIFKKNGEIKRRDDQVLKLIEVREKYPNIPPPPPPPPGLGKN
ncbi:hypothetical protein SAMN04487910_4624 [Aquimarina amphilecti]|uniref:Uncharacterized protein n=1 Tax=Aquimarina amphilecti TaxID=1038014 RepID=A0A1H7X3R9_AQUAM|nr:hypothetical protein [Aquimarina amphilecti]SEM28520.1 hypothetical protein SAMN04487910_4624 [Aquimarina amphilecti]